MTERPGTRGRLRETEAAAFLVGKGWLSLRGAERLFGRAAVKGLVESPMPDDDGVLVFRYADSNGGPFTIAQGAGEKLDMAGSLLESLVNHANVPNYSWSAGSARYGGQGFWWVSWIPSAVLEVLRAEAAIPRNWAAGDHLVPMTEAGQRLMETPVTLKYRY